MSVYTDEDLRSAIADVEVEGLEIYEADIGWGWKIIDRECLYYFDNPFQALLDLIEALSNDFSEHENDDVIIERPSGGSFNFADLEEEGF